MRRFVVPMVLGAFAITAVSTRAEAQNVFLGGGLSIPLGEFKDLAKTGWMLQGGFGFDLGSSGAFIEAEGFFGSNSHKGTTGSIKAKTNIISFMGALGYSFGADDAKTRPYIPAGAGMVSNQFRSDAPQAPEGTETKFGFTGAAGVTFRLNEQARFWLEARVISASGTSVIPFMAGVSIDLGSSGN